MWKSGAEAGGGLYLRWFVEPSYIVLRFTDFVFYFVIPGCVSENAPRALSNQPCFFLLVAKYHFYSRCCFDPNERARARLVCRFMFLQIIRGIVLKSNNIYLLSGLKVNLSNVNKLVGC